MPDLIKKFSSTVIALVILVLIAGYFFIFERGKSDKEDQGSRLFPGIKKEEISSMELVYPDAKIVLSKESEDWFLIKNSKKYKADSFTISSMVDSFADLKTESDISSDDGELSQYGLRDPRAEIKANIAETLYSIKIGIESPVGSGVYLKVGKVPGVKLVDAGLIWPFLDRTFNDLRDKEIINLEEESITRVSFDAGDFSKTFTKQDGKWVSEGLADYIDINHLKIEGIVRSFSDLRVVGFESDEPENLSRYGLDKPSAVLTIFEGDTKIKYAFGARKEQADYYMKLSTAESVYLVSSHNFDQLPKSIDDLRIAKLFDFADHGISSIKMRNSDNSFQLIKKNNEWFVENSEGQADQEKIGSLVNELLSLEVAEFVDDNPNELKKYGLDSAGISIILNENGSALLIGTETDEQVYAKKSDRNSVYLIDSNILTLLPKNTHDLLLTAETDEQSVGSR